MFKEIQERFYLSFSESVKGRKKILNVIRDDILPDPVRVSRIINLRHDKHHPYLIGNSEYPRLNLMFHTNSHEEFIAENDTCIGSEKLIEKFGTNYDKMLWGHIDWDKMFQDVITELSEPDISDYLGKRFELTLVDYVPYAVIKYDELHPECGLKYIFPDERQAKRQKAIEWVHLRHGSGLFKQTFYERFSGKTLREFDKEFNEFVLDYLRKRKPSKYSFGLQTYNTCKNLSGYSAYWQKLPEVQYGDVDDKKSKSQKQLEKYIDNGREQIRKLEKFQQEFDKLHIDIK